MKTFVLIFLLILSHESFAFADDEVSELSIEMKGSSKLTGEKAADKSTTILKKYQKSKTALINAFGISTSPKKDQKDSKISPVIEKSKEKITTVILKNGQMIEATRITKDQKGMWIEMGEGTKVYFSKEEIERINE